MVIEIVKLTTAQNTTEHLLRVLCTRFELPKVLIEDNETYVYTSLVVTSEFTSRNGVKHFCIDPYHPFSNGQAERAVQTFKLELKKQSAGNL